MRNIFIILLFCFLAIACNKSEPPATTPKPTERVAKPKETTKTIIREPLTTQLLLQHPVEAVMTETPHQALPTWRKYAKGQPVLVLFGNDPYLQPIPAELQEEVTELLQSASDAELIRRSDVFASDPALLPTMALRAALQAGYFSQVIWIFPSKVSSDNLSLAAFQQQLRSANLATPEETDSFTLADGFFCGEIAHTPFTAAHPDALPKIVDPVVLHFDLSYFKAIYKGEIKTPLYPMILDLLTRIKAAGWHSAGVSISFSNLTGEIPLASRFVGNYLAELFKNPTLLDSAPTLQWQRRSNALYLENFMQKDEMRKLYLDMEKEAPKDASVKYSLYKIFREFKENDRALESLRQAAELDHVYALEYLALSDAALNGRRPDKAIDMFETAHAKMPENPFITFSMIRTGLATGQSERVKQYIPALQGLAWSTVYYPGMADEINALALEANPSKP